MDIRKGQILEVDIEDMAFEGLGLVRVDGFVVFVAGAVPEDRMVVEIFRKKKNFAEAKKVSLLRPSPYRVSAPCPYSGLCGGCKWQFLDYGKQLEYKRRHVVESLAHIGGVRDVPVHPVLPSERVFGYRNKMEFSCSDRRWRLPEEMDRPEDDSDAFALGLHVPGNFYKILDTHTCLLQPDPGDRILAFLRSAIRASGEPVYGLRSHIGFWRFVMLRHSVARNEWMVNLITAFENRELLIPIAEKLREAFPEIVSVVNNVTARKAAIAVGESEGLLSGAHTLRDRIGRFEFDISANSFFQTNTCGAARLYDTVRTYAGLSGEETVLDLYTGTGTIAISLSDAVRRVLGVELVPSAVEDARKNCRLNSVENCRFIQADIRDCISNLNVDPDVVVIDPPRAGMHSDVVKGVLDLAPSRIVYVSCNPATQARDLSILKESYEIVEVQPVDMFPHTHHIESVARLSRR